LVRDDVRAFAALTELDVSDWAVMQDQGVVRPG
jgi:hypothetical protein